MVKSYIRFSLVLIMSNKLEWNPLHGSVLAITAITLIGIGLIAVGSDTVTAGPADPSP